MPTFTAEQEALLVDPARWSFAGRRPHAPRNTPAVTAYSEWMRRNAHAHAYTEILFILDGRIFASWKGAPYRTRPGTVLHYGPFEPHDMGYLTKCGPFEHLWISIMPGHFGLNRVVSAPGPGGYRRVWHALISSSEALVSPACFLRPKVESSEHSEALFRLRLQGGLRILLAAAAAKSRQPPEDRAAPTFQRNAVKAIQQHIDETAGRGVTLDTLARLSGYSKYHFLRLFQRNTGMTPQQYIDNCRRKHARRLLEEGWSRKALARELGFNHASSFSRWAARHLRS